MSTSPLIKLQEKCGVAADGAWGPSTYNAAKTYFKLSDNQAAHFFGQCAHESGDFKIFSENLNYSASGLTNTFRKYFPDQQSTVGYAKNPEKIANKVYGNRMGNGPESSGDGWKFRGRGPIQLTGKDNYTAFAAAMNRPDILTNPEIVANELAFESALFFFNNNKLFTICDKGLGVDIITALTKRVNGGTHGLADRIAKTQKFALWNK